MRYATQAFIALVALVATVLYREKPVEPLVIVPDCCSQKEVMPNASTPKHIVTEPGQQAQTGPAQILTAPMSKVDNSPYKRAGSGSIPDGATVQPALAPKPKELEWRSDEPGWYGLFQDNVQIGIYETRGRWWRTLKGDTWGPRIELPDWAPPLPTEEKVPAVERRVFLRGGNC